MGYVLSRQSLVKKIFGDNYVRKIWDGGAFGVKPAFRSIPHTGVDYGANVGERVHAMEEMTILAVRAGIPSKSSSFGSNKDYGDYVMGFIPAYGITVLYSHVAPSVKVGDKVKAGVAVGTINRSGFNLGAHLHFGYATGSIKDLNAFNKVAKDFEKFVIPAKQTIADIARLVIAGKMGNGAERVANIKNAGFDPSVVQSLVNDMLAPTKPATPTRKTNEEIAKEVLQGKWGNGADRKKRIVAAGYNYDAIQKIVNKLAG